MYIQCKLALQVQSKHIKIFKKKKNKTKQKVHLTNWINQKKTFHEPLALFIYLIEIDMPTYINIKKGKKKPLGTIEINVKML